MKRIFRISSLIGGALLSATLLSPVRANQLDDVIARVGDQEITFSLLNTMLNSSAIVGLSVPALGTPERHQVRVTLLDKVISANLLYLDALEKGVDKAPEHQRNLKRFSDSILASLYRKKVLIGEVPVSDEQVKAYFEANITPGTELTDDLRTALEATLRKQEFKKRVADIRGRLRQGLEVHILSDKLDPEGDGERADETVVATFGDDSVRWGEVKDSVMAASKKANLAPMNLDEPDEREEVINRHIDGQIMARQAKVAGLDQEKAYQARIKEYTKTSLVNFHRTRLLKQWDPDELELGEYYEANKARIAVPETRKVQMVVLKNEQDAADIKRRIDAGDITIYEAALEYSADPNANRTLGEIGWVTKGTGFPELDKVTFALEPGEIGGPVESPAGWHLVKVNDIRDARYDDFDNEETRRVSRRMLLHEKQDQYVVDLRQHHFKVEVYQDKLKELFERENQWIAALEEKAKNDPAAAEASDERLKKLQGMVR